LSIQNALLYAIDALTALFQDTVDVEVNISSISSLSSHSTGGIPRGFRRQITSTEQSSMLKTLKRLTSVCDQLGVVYMLYGGSLLGSFRHHDLGNKPVFFGRPYRGSFTLFQFSFPVLLHRCHAYTILYLPQDHIQLLQCSDHVENIIQCPPFVQGTVVHS